MKKILSFITIMLIINIIGCEAKIKSDNNYIKEEDFQYMYMNKNSEQYITTSDEGYYFINGLYLYYCDFSSMEPVVLCNKPNCLHDKELDETKKFNCDAFLITGQDSKLLTVYDDYIYCYIEMDFLKDKDSKPELIRISKDGSKRKTICELEENITSMALHRGNLYYAVSNISLDEEEADNGIYEYKLKSYDLFNPFSNPKTIYSGKNLFGIINDITPIGNKIRYSENFVEDAVMKGNEFVYDINKKNTYRLADDIGASNIGPLSISNGEFIFTPININDGDVKCDDYMYKANIESGVSELLFKREFSDIMHYSDDNYIYIDNILSFNSNEIDYEDFTRNLVVYDRNGNKVDSINITGIDEFTYFVSGDDRYMFVKGQNLEGAYIKYIDKSKIGTGTAKLETLFELEKKYLDTSVRMIVE